MTFIFHQEMQIAVSYVICFLSSPIDYPVCHQVILYRLALDITIISGSRKCACIVGLFIYMNRTGFVIRKQTCSPKVCSVEFHQLVWRSPLGKYWKSTYMYRTGSMIRNNRLQNVDTSRKQKSMFCGCIVIL